jgi:hypothetical protein
MIHEAKLQLLDKFQENVECLNYEGFSEAEAKRQSFSELLPKLSGVAKGGATAPPIAKKPFSEKG